MNVQNGVEKDKSGSSALVGGSFQQGKPSKTKDLRPTIDNKRKATTTPYVPIRAGPDARLMRVTFTPLINSASIFIFAAKNRRVYHYNDRFNFHS